MKPSTHHSLLFQALLLLRHPIQKLKITSSSFQLFCLLTSLIGVGIASPVYAQSYPQPATGGTLQPDAQGGSVADLQRRLSDLGYYNGPVTGYFDSSTQAAVSRFQQDNGLAPDGIVGPATSSALGGGAPSPISTAEASQSAAGSYVQLNNSGNQVSQLQQQLAQLGYYNGSVTGVFDASTQAAVISFQRDRGLAPDGIVGSATEAALYQSPQQAATSAPTTGSATSTPGAPAYTPSATPSDGLLQLGDAGAEVSDLQTKLQALGYYDGPISGSFGSQTQVALIAFQQAQGLTADGIAGPRVNTALGTVSAPTQTAASQPTTITTPTQAAASQPTAIAAPTQAAAQSSITTTPITTPQPIGTEIPTAVPSTAQSQATVQVPPITSPMPPSVAPTQSQPIAQSSTPRSNQQIQNLEGGRFSVAELQRRLHLRGFDPVEMTGVYDPATQNAVTQAQQAYGLSQSDLFEE